MNIKCSCDCVATLDTTIDPDGTTTIVGYCNKHMVEAIENRDAYTAIYKVSQDYADDLQSIYNQGKVDAYYDILIKVLSGKLK